MSIDKFPVLYKKLVEFEQKFWQTTDRYFSAHPSRAPSLASSINIICNQLPLHFHQSCRMMVIFHMLRAYSEFKLWQEATRVRILITKIQILKLFPLELSCWLRNEWIWGRNSWNIFEPNLKLCILLQLFDRLDFSPMLFSLCFHYIGFPLL